MYFKAYQFIVIFDNYNQNNNKNKLIAIIHHRFDSPIKMTKTPFNNIIRNQISHIKKNISYYQRLNIIYNNNKN